MENYIALLLLVVPGFVARKIYAQLNDHLPEKNTFLETMYSLIYSIFVLLVLYIGYVSVVSCGDGGIITIQNIQGIFNNPKFIASYAVMSLFASILIAFVWYKIQPYYMKIINFARQKSGKNKIEIDKTVFDEAFNDGKVHWVEIYKDNKLLSRGIIKRMNYCRNELYLEDAEEQIQLFLNEAGRVKKYRGSYIDHKSNIIIKEIDSSEIE